MEEEKDGCPRNNHPEQMSVYAISRLGQEEGSPTQQAEDPWENILVWSTASSSKSGKLSDTVEWVAGQPRWECRGGAIVDFVASSTPITWLRYFARIPYLLP